MKQHGSMIWPWRLGQELENKADMEAPPTYSKVTGP
jgi:hypothetical protein